jgi:hypothetical protein
MAAVKKEPDRKQKIMEERERERSRIIRERDREHISKKGSSRRKSRGE